MMGSPALDEPIVCGDSMVGLRSVVHSVGGWIWSSQNPISVRNLPVLPFLCQTLRRSYRVFTGFYSVFDDRFQRLLLLRTGHSYGTTVHCTSSSSIANVEPM